MADREDVTEELAHIPGGGVADVGEQGAEQSAVLKTHVIPDEKATESANVDVLQAPPYDGPQATIPSTPQEQSNAETTIPDSSSEPSPSSPAVGHLSTTSGPPSLNYTLRTRYLSITIFWSLILIDSIAIPIGLYFGLWYGTNLSPNAVFSISTGALGGVSIFEYFLRFWRLWKKGSTCRVLGARRWYLDWFHWNFSAAWIFIMAELIIGTVFTNPPIRLLAMPVSSLCFWFGVSLMVQDIMRLMHMNCPIRISSVPKGEPLRMGIYSIIEDVIAVDGGGGTEFRTRLNARYEASHWFRLMLHRLTLFWATGALGAATVTTILVFTLEKDPAYVVGWVLPFIWAGIWAFGTWIYVTRCLRREHKMWGSHRKDSFVVTAPGA